jgi:hypothetical protein
MMSLNEYQAIADAFALNWARLKERFGSDDAREKSRVDGEITCWHKLQEAVEVALTSTNVNLDVDWFYEACKGRKTER